MRICAFLVLSICLAACSKHPEYRSNEGEVWSTRYRVVYQSDKELGDSINEVFCQIGRSVSVFNDSSTVSRINRNETVEIDTDFQSVFKTSQYVHQLTQGAFDPTVGPLIELYGFGRQKQSSEPTDGEIDSVMQFVGIDGCMISDGRIQKKSPHTTFNFSGIAKGYGVDLIAEMLRRNGVENFLIEIGGDIAGYGKNAQGEPWAIMLEPTQHILHLTSGAVATSGNYRKHYGEHGHIIDPRSGRPTRTGLPAVSVVAPTCMIADAIATACMVADIDTINNVLIIRANKPNDY